MLAFYLRGFIEQFQQFNNVIEAWLPSRLRNHGLNFLRLNTRVTRCLCHFLSSPSSAHQKQIAPDLSTNYSATAIAKSTYPIYGLKLARALSKSQMDEFGSRAWHISRNNLKGGRDFGDPEALARLTEDARRCMVEVATIRRDKSKDKPTTEILHIEVGEPQPKPSKAPGKLKK